MSLFISMHSLPVAGERVSFFRVFFIVCFNLHLKIKDSSKSNFYHPENSVVS